MVDLFSKYLVYVEDELPFTFHRRLISEAKYRQYPERKEVDQKKRKKLQEPQNNPYDQLKRKISNLVYS